MKVAIIGSGYVGLVAGTCFAEMGNEVWCIDINDERIKNLKNGIIPIYEPGLDILVVKNYQGGRLKFTTSLSEGIKEALFVFIAVGTPPNEDGSADLQHVLGVASEIGREMQDYKIVIDKSTVPVGTADKVKAAIAAELKDRGVSIGFDVVSNPEFLKEGDAVNDFMHPDRVVIGTESDEVAHKMRELYSPFFRKNPRVLFMDVKSAEVTKYASNAMLATKISFMNEMANLCDRVGADVENVRLGIGADARIGYSFIYPGIGYGGSCFPKDVKAIIHTGEQNDYSMNLLKAVEAVNKEQKEVLFHKIKRYYASKGESLKDKTFAVWGLSFKPETDDMREAPSLVILRKLVAEGATIKAHDPKAVEEAKHLLADIADSVQFVNYNYDAVTGCDALILLTEWHMYRQPDFKRIKKNLAKPVLFDGRNQYDPVELSASGFSYISIGRRDYEKNQ
jgi:UDPglucose 6-dehydrogenase